MPENNAKELLRRAEKMFGAKQTHMSLWQELADQLYPERGEFTQMRYSAESFAPQLYSTDPILMRRDLGNVLSVMARPSDMIWFQLDVPDERMREESGTREWLESRTMIMRRALYDPKALFVPATKTADQDFVTFGNGVISVEETENARLRHICHHLKDCAWADDFEGSPDTLARKFEHSARTAKKFFSKPGDQLHRDVIKECEPGRDPDKPFKFMHVMMPAEDYEYVSRERPRLRTKWVSIYVDCEHQTIVREAPSHEFRYVVPRWHVVSNCAYAISPAALAALPDSRMLQALARIIQEAGEKSVDPAMKIVQQAILGGEINLQAGGSIWVDRDYDERTGPAIEPIMLGKDAALGLHMFDRLRATLQECWYLNKLSIPQQNEKTAFETAQLVQEFIRGSVPLFEPVMTNYNAPLLDMQAQILFRVGAFGRPEEMPDALRESMAYGQELLFTFNNPLQDAIEKKKVLDYKSVAELTLIAEGLDPSLKANLDTTTMYRDAVGAAAPAKWLLDREDAQESIEAAQQQQQAMMAMQAAGGMAEVAKAGGQAVKAIGEGGKAMKEAA